MRYASYAVTGAPSTGSIISRQVSKLTVNLFTSIFCALYQSQRAQARRALDRYRHLVSRASDEQAQDPPANGGRP